MPRKSKAQSQRPRAKTAASLWLVACGLWLLLTACEVTPSEQFQPQLVVQGLILAGSDSVQVNINRSYAIDEPFDSVFADVNGVVWRGSDTWSLAHGRRDVYATREPYPRPAPGDSFGIRIAKNGFDTVYGKTLVPDSFRILFPRDGDTITMSDSMVWTRSRNCAGYYMSIRSIERNDTFYYTATAPNDTSGNNFDSLVFKLRQMVFLYLYEPGIHTLRVYALDTNYFDWVRIGGFGGGTDTATRLSGGLGVFGSGVGDSVKVYVTVDTAAQRTGCIVRQGPSRPTQKSEGRAQMPNPCSPDACGLRLVPVARPY
jgi:hypothetical protein